MESLSKNTKLAIGALVFVMIFVIVSRKLNASKRKKVSNQYQADPNNGAGNQTSNIDFNKNIGIGDVGPEVGQLQVWLNHDGANPVLEVDDNFGPLTQAALIAETGLSEIMLINYNNERGQSNLDSYRRGFTTN